MWLVAEKIHGRPKKCLLTYVTFFLTPPLVTTGVKKHEKKHVWAHYKKCGLFFVPFLKFTLPLLVFFLFLPLLEFRLSRFSAFRKTGSSKDAINKIYGNFSQPPKKAVTDLRLFHGDPCLADLNNPSKFQRPGVQGAPKK
jgi:hypothetical protein